MIARRLTKRPKARRDFLSVMSTKGTIRHSGMASAKHPEGITNLVWLGQTSTPARLGLRTLSVSASNQDSYQLNLQRNVPQPLRHVCSRGCRGLSTGWVARILENYRRGLRLAAISHC